jgi:NAD(P)-dependent dehydrogenase (short-subunit alcohol dehydrogenase family)
VRADLSSARQAEALIGKCRARGVRLTCLVNSAALFKLDRAPTAKAADFRPGTSFADWGISNPSFGPVTTEDNGILEFSLVFVPA